MRPETVRCKGKKKDGSKCPVMTASVNGFCYFHDPTRAKERSENNKRGSIVRVNGVVKRKGKKKPQAALSLIGITIQDEVRRVVREILLGEKS